MSEMLNRVLNGRIVEFSNGQAGVQPGIVIRGKDNCYYLITATPERKFLISYLRNYENRKC